MDFLPNQLPDELLFSRLIRHLMLSGTSPSDYLRKYLGSIKVSFNPLLPGRLKQLALTFKESPEAFLFHQTVIPLYLYFLPQYHRKIATLALEGRTSMVVRACQIPNFSTKSRLVLNSCPRCASGDIRRLGISYWHRAHQLPGIIACPIHGCVLQPIALPARQRIIHGLLPGEDEGISATSLEFKLAKYAFQVLNKASCGKERFQSSLYRRNLSKLGLVTNRQSFKRASILNSFLEYCESLPNTNRCHKPASDVDFKYISKLIAGEHPQNPVKHFLFGHWLSIELEKHPLIGCTHSEHTCVGDEVNQLIEKRAIAMLKQGQSLNKVSKALQKSRCYLKRLALLNGIKISRCPRTIDEGARGKIAHLAYLGFHTTEISKRVGANRSSIEYEISCVPGLVKWRKKCRKDSIKRRHMHAILSYLQDNPHAIRSAIKYDCSSAYFWLYHNRRDWLESVLPQALRPKLVIKKNS